MSTMHSHFTTRRVTDPTIVGLEVWDLAIEDESINDHCQSAAYPSMVAQQIGLMLGGEARRKSGHRLPIELLRAISCIYLGGGRTLSPAVGDAFRQAPLPVHFCANGQFVGEPGGMSILGDEHQHGLVVDVGQTAIKLCVQGQRLVVPRDLDWLPYNWRTEPAEELLYRNRFRQFLSSAIEQALALATEPVGSAVIALATGFADDGTPHGNSYPGLKGYGPCIQEAFSHAGNWRGHIVHYLNDAELAAHSARTHPAIAGSDQMTLVLTMGTALGGAILLPTKPVHSAAHDAAITGGH